MRRSAILFTLITVLVLCAVIGGLYWVQNRPASNASAAMARGQYELARQYYSKQADQGDPVAQNALANLFYLGLGVDTDYKQAASLYFAASKKGYAAAQLNLGHLYKQGLGVSADRVRAFGWYSMSNRYGNPVAEYYLTQLATEYSMTPNQISTALKRWAQLDALVNEGL